MVLLILAGLTASIGPVGVVVVIANGAAVDLGFSLPRVIGAELGLFLLVEFVWVLVRRHVVLHKVPR